MEEINNLFQENIDVAEQCYLSVDCLNVNTFDIISCEEYLFPQKDIPLDVEFITDIFIELEFNLTGKELIYMESLTVDRTEQRRELVARNYFVLRRSIRQIAEGLSIHTATVSKDLEIIRFDTLNKIKKDVRANKKILGHMVEMMYELTHQSKVLWDKYYELENDAVQFRRMMVQLRQGTDTDMGLLLERSHRIMSIEKMILMIHDRMQTYQNSIRQTSRQLLDVWERFGLCGEDALKVIFSGGIDIDVKVQEVKQMMLTMAGIVKSEVKEQTILQKIFSKMAREIKPDAIGRKSKNRDEYIIAQ